MFVLFTLAHGPGLDRYDNLFGTKIGKIRYSIVTTLLGSGFCHRA